MGEPIELDKWKFCDKCKHERCKNCKVVPMFYHFSTRWVCCRCGETVDVST